MNHAVNSGDISGVPDMSDSVGAMGAASSHMSVQEVGGWPYVTADIVFGLHGKSLLDFYKQLKLVRMNCT